MSTTTHLIALPRLVEAMQLVVRGFGSADDEVRAVAGNLIEANLTGHDSHGIGMLPRYAKSYLEGGLKPNTGVSVLHDAGSLLRLDGNAGFGQVVGTQAMELGIERAKAQGSCIVALGNAHHLGRIGAWAEQAAAAGLVSLHFVNVISRAIVAPHGGGDARFGTNPFCAGVPLAGRAPVIMDFATSVIAQGKTRVAHNKGEAVEAGQLIDDHGRPTTNPRYTVIPPFGALLTFGAHKGYGLALMNELFAGLIGGSLPTLRGRPEAAPRDEKTSSCFFFQVIHPEALDCGAFARGRTQASNLKAVLEDVFGHGNEGCTLPGTLEHRAAQRSQQAGVLLFTPAEVQEFEHIAQEAGLRLDHAQLRPFTP